MTEKDFVEQVAAHPERPHIFAAAVSDQKDPKESHVRYCDIRVRPCTRFYTHNLHILAARLIAP